MVNKEKITRRKLLISGGITLTVGLPLLTLTPLWESPLKDQGLKLISAKEKSVLASLIPVWVGSEEAHPYGAYESLLLSFDKVLQTVREDHRYELRLALKLLAWPPSCFALTGSFYPWDGEPKAIRKIIEKWKGSSQAHLQKIYGGLNGLIFAALYAQESTFEGIGYPGPPEVDV